MEPKRYEYDGIIREIPENGGAYIVFPWDIRAEFGKGRVKVHAEFDGVPYEGSVVNMGVKDENGNVCYRECGGVVQFQDAGDDRCVQTHLGPVCSSESWP